MKLLQATVLTQWLSITAAHSLKRDYPATPVPEDLNGSNFTYPWPVNTYDFTSQRQALQMAFMDVSPTNSTVPNNRTALLLHGKNFCGATWEGTARALLSTGWRVILPDQVGFCKSTKPAGYQFSLQQLASNTHDLLQSLGVGNVTVIGHSMGGMLGTRYTLMYPSSVDALVLVNPIGLEDWKAKGVPYQSIDVTAATEAKSNYTSIRAYEQATYYVNTWKPEYDVWVNMLVNVYWGRQRERFVWNQAQTTDMVLSQPVVYEFGLLKPKTLLMVGMKDNTAIGKQWSPPEVQKVLGRYDLLGKEVVEKIPRGELVEWEDLGHSPQIQDPARFEEALLGWLGAGK
ncbi:alpha/beta-hydrolase [Aaosphaeria arxii CBS 175.79]|uniref:Alpha/beta-hydrolase n=1 Tax=Aaosphaeria arxii CBS 175.79 TaxID=1450172 RepID=A0A6A5XRD2_9PLEO|nr:alpha/beta-hydrolase [Aaosphaeria arxii CBS 175.79]KAF2015311.1 alpha/beta-hydrolase [Aaosphaeria arxii CBS 175.79]